MLIITTPNSQPRDFHLLAQNMQTYEICGLSNAEGYNVVHDIPEGFEQRCLPPEHGKYLTLAQIIKEDIWPEDLTPAQKRQKSYDYLPLIEWEGERLTVTQAAQKFVYYNVRANSKEHPEIATRAKTKAEQLAELNAAATESIYGMYPDGKEDATT
jgi:hypothetical protein